MKKILLFWACLLALASPLQAAVAPPEIVVVRVYCSYGCPIKAVITRSEGKSELVDLRYKHADSSMSRSEEELMQNNESYYRLCQRFYQQGYTLQSTLTSPLDNTDSYATLFFAKAQ
jgi:hypothetical protein